MDHSQKKARDQRKLIVFADESGLSERPSIRSTWGRRGQTPAVVHSHRWVKRSMMAGLIYHWSGKPTKLTFEIIENAYKLPDILRWCQLIFPRFDGPPV